MSSAARLGLGLRGLPLFAAILATWLAGLVGPYVFQSLVRPFIPVAWLLQWTGSGMLPGDWQDVALAALAEDVPLFVAHRVLYLAAAGVVVVTLALAYRRRRWVKTRVRWGLRMTAAALVLLTLASSAGFVATLYAQADAARAELLHYARNGVASLYAGPEPDPRPRSPSAATNSTSTPAGRRRSSSMPGSAWRTAAARPWRIPSSPFATSSP